MEWLGYVVVVMAVAAVVFVVAGLVAVAVLAVFAVVVVLVAFPSLSDIHNGRKFGDQPITCNFLFSLHESSEFLIVRSRGRQARGPATLKLYVNDQADRPTDSSTSRPTVVPDLGLVLQLFSQLAF